MTMENQDLLAGLATNRIWALLSWKSAIDLRRDAAAAKSILVDGPVDWPDARTTGKIQVHGLVGSGSLVGGLLMALSSNQLTVLNIRR